MKFRISRLAQNDLEEIWLFTKKNWSISQADRYLNLLFDEIDFIVGNPASGSDFSHIRDGYFRTKVKSHFIFYRIGASDGLIEIIRIIHKRMDAVERLKD
jgi:toxin ParE1/3/4